MKNQSSVFPLNSSFVASTNRGESKDIDKNNNNTIKTIVFGSRIKEITNKTTDAKVAKYGSTYYYYTPKFSLCYKNNKLDYITVDSTSKFIKYSFDNEKEWYWLVS